METAEIILNRIREIGVAERQVSLEAFGHDTGIRDLKRIGSMSAARLKNLCKVLDLELHVGPRKHGEFTCGDGTVYADPEPGFAGRLQPFLMDPPGANHWSRLSARPPAEAFMIEADFEFQANVPSARFLIVEPDVDPASDALAFIESTDGLVAIGQYQGKTRKGWHRILRHGGAMVDEWHPTALRRLHPVTWVGSGMLPVNMVGRTRDLERIAEREETLRRMREKSGQASALMVSAADIVESGI